MIKKLIKQLEREGKYLCISFSYFGWYLKKYIFAAEKKSFIGIIIKNIFLAEISSVYLQGPKKYN
jgi:hypothetical protein